jgi:hypothetical protein
MYRKVGIRIGAGSGDLREKRLLGHKIPACGHDRLRKRCDCVGTEFLVGNQVKRRP